MAASETQHSVVCYVVVADVVVVLWRGGWEAAERERLPYIRLRRTHTHDQ